MPTTMPLFAEFDAATKQEWLAKIEKDLKGKPLGEFLVSPFHHQDDFEGQFPSPILTKKTNNSWEIGETITVNDLKKANQDALIALQGGASSLFFELQEAKNVGMEALLILFKDIELNYISVFISGNLSQECLEKYPSLRPQSIAFETAEKDAVQQLVGLLKNAEGLPNVENMSLKINIGTDYFTEIAKIRALKILWGNWTQNRFGQPMMPYIDAYCTNDYTDLNYQKIALATQAMSAVIGGVNRLTLQTSNMESEFEKRICRNIQHLLYMESYMEKVQDPASGAYFIEHLTQKIANEVWEKWE